MKGGVEEIKLPERQQRFTDANTNQQQLKDGVAHVRKIGVAHQINQKNTTQHAICTDIPWKLISVLQTEFIKNQGKRKDQNILRTREM